MLAIGMELPEDTFVNLHNFGGVGDTHGAHYLVIFSTGSGFDLDPSWTVRFIK